MRTVTEFARCFVSAPMAWKFFPRWRIALRRCLGGVFGWALLAGMPAAENSRRTYELPAGDAATMLRELSAISGREILFAADAVRGVRTNALRGSFTPFEAVNRLLAGTTLSVVQDEKTGALAVRRERRPPSPKPRSSADK